MDPSPEAGVPAGSRLEGAGDLASSAVGLATGPGPDAGAEGAARRVLVSAFACDPYAGSEGGRGWQWVREIARRHACWLITRPVHVAAIETAAREEGLESLRVHGFDLPAWTRLWRRDPRGLLPYLYLWQLGSMTLARRLDREVDFDLVHDLGHGSSHAPSGMAFVGKPFLWGPLGRRSRVPDRFLLGSDLSLRLGEWARDLMGRALPRLDPFLRAAARRADRILGPGLPTRERVVPMLAGGCSALPSRVPARRRGERFRVLFIGPLSDRAGARLALAAFARFAAHAPNVDLHLVGDGSRRALLERLAVELGVPSRVVFHGGLQHDEALEHVPAADVLLSPSFETADPVLVEAMARGCPVVCLDVGGAGELVNGTRGLRVPVRASFDRTTLGLATGLSRLYESERLRRVLARSAAEWAAANATWEAQGARLASLYAEVARARRVA